MNLFTIVSLTILAFIKVQGSEILETPRFGVLQTRSVNDVPSISVAFPDGHKDTLVLHRYYSNEKNRMAQVARCNFIGHLANEPEACVAMTGCIGSEDVEFTILSTHSPKARAFKWTKEGQVEILKQHDSLHGVRKGVKVDSRQFETVQSG